jgi:nucleotide-binding universal stress UspA family protein
MIRRILVALDPDADTPAAIDFAFSVAKRYSAEVTGIACVDTDRIEGSSSGGGIGSMYYAEKLRKKLTEKTRERAQELIEAFEEASATARIRYVDEVKEGAPSERIIEDMRFHDILVIGKDPHFFYGHPEQKTTTLAHVVKGCVAPVLVVPDEFREVKTALIAFDGSAPSTRAMQRFFQLQPFGNELNVHIVNVYEKKAGDRADFLLTQAQKYAEIHQFDAHIAALKGDHPFETLMGHAEQIEADLIVAGAHSVSKVQKLAFGSTTETLIKNGRGILFLDR